MSTKKLQIIDYNIKQAENADTVDGKHASDFAAADDVSDLQVKVGDTSVSEQISTAISEIDYPVDSVNGKTGVVMLTANDVGALPVDTEIPSISGLATETYVDSKVAGIVGSAPETLDTLNELSAALGNDPNFATTIATQIGGKVDKVDGKGLSTNDYTTDEKNKLAGIEAGANKTTIDSELSSTSTNPVQNKVVTTQINNLNTLVGDTTVSDQISTAIADKVDKVSGKGLSTNDYTTAEKNKLSGIASGAEVNQNAFSNVIVGSTTVAADTATDTLTLVAGNNVTLTPDATNDKITIAAKDTTYSAATTSAAGLMSASDKTKLNGIATGATKVTVDSALSSTSTNPVQNKVVNTAISNLNTLVGDTAVSTQIDNAIASIDAATVDDITAAIDNIEIGSRNIATGTANMVVGLINTATWSNGQWRYSGTGSIESIDITDSPIPSISKGIRVTSSAANKQIGIVQNKIPLNSDNIYTLSCWVRGSAASGLKCKLQPFYASSTDNGGILEIDITDQWQYVSFTTVRSPQNTAEYSAAYIYLISSAIGDTMDICGVKLERGNKATDWSPAPEDLAIVSIAAENPSEGIPTYIPFCKGVSNGTNLLINNGVRYNTKEGTTTSDGYAEFILGNNTPTGTAGNKFSDLRMYGHNDKYESFRPYERTENATKYLVGTSSAVSVGDTDTPVYINSDGVITPTDKKFSNYLPLTGGTVTGTLVLSKTQNASGTANNSPALIVGGSATSAHLEFDANEIMAKSNGTTPSTLSINLDGGKVYIGSGGLQVNGSATFTDTTTLQKASGDTYFVSHRTDLNKKLTFGISSAGNRGIYDSDLKWLIYANPTNDVIVNGTITKGAISEERSYWTGITGYTFNYATGRNRALILAWMEYGTSTYTGFNFITISSSTTTTSSATTLIQPSSTVGLFYSVKNGNIIISGGAEGASYKCTVIWFTV